MQVFNALQLKKGAKVEQNKMGTITLPIQFLSSKKKDEQWAAWNLDWLEWNGLKQLRRNSRRLLKSLKSFLAFAMFTIKIKMRCQKKITYTKVL